MKHIKALLLLLLLLFAISASLPLSRAAKIYGTIYNSALEKETNVEISINTVPAQFMVSKDSEYSFDVPAGTYTLAAGRYEYNELKSGMEDEITVNSDGAYRLDLILIPVFDDFGEAETDFIEDSFAAEKKDISPAIILSIISFVLLSFFTITYLSRRKNKKDNKISLPDDLEDIYSYIQKNKRTTQKDIRKNFPLSEAKISLILSELEEKGKIKKIKKGRGNIIIAN